MKTQTYISYNNTIFKYIVLGIMLVITSNMNGQKTPISFPSPEAASLGSVGNIPIDYHTGSININIPLFDIDVKGYGMPISLQYNSSGFRPAIRPTWVGQNWTLKAGGVIVRTINGMPDEKEMFGFIDPESCRRLQRDDWYTDDKLDPTLAESTMSKTPSDYDTEPDEFTFNVNGVSGKFCFDNSGKIKVLSDPSIKVEYYDARMYIRDIYTFKGFKITLNDGVICYFGYNSDLIETNVTRQNGNFSSPIINATSWYLYKIEVPQSGENIIFKYSQKYINEDYIWMESKVNLSNDFSSCYGQNEDGHAVTTEHIYLQSIETNDSELRFFTSIQSDRYDDINWQKLDSVKLISKFSNNVLKKVVFNYSGPRIFLESLKESGKPPYEFTYRGGTDVAYKCREIDHWGYCNGFTSRSMICSAVDGYRNCFEINRETDPTYVLTGSLQRIKYPTGGVVNFEFEANSYSRFCVFENKSVNLGYINRAWSDWVEDLYFTNGELVVQDPIYFQMFYTPKDTIDVKEIKERLNPGRYDYKYFGLKENINNYFYNIRYKKLQSSCDAYCGGLRIKKVTQQDGDNEIIHEYKYKYNYELGGNISSGILGTLPIYDYSIAVEDIISKICCSQGLTPLSLTQGSHIGYSEVTEINKDKNNNVLGYKVFKYTNFDTNKDDPPVNMRIYAGYDMGVRNWREYERGKLYYEAAYSKDNKKVFQKTYDYSVEEGTPIRAIQFKGALVAKCDLQKSINDWTGIAYYVYNNSYLLSKETETRYDLLGLNPVTTTIQYFYNKLNFIKDKIVMGSDDNPHVTEITYSGDDVSWENDVYPAMKVKNMLSYPIETKEFVRNWVTGAELTTYKEITTANSRKTYVPDRLYKMKTLVDPFSFPFCDYKGGSVDGRYDKYPEIEYAIYDKAANINQTITRDSLNKTYLWSYNTRYPIAEIVNADYSLVENILGGAHRIQDFSNKINPSTAEIEAFLSPLNTDSRMKNSLITYYSYNPLIGIASKTDPRGVTTYYEYDELGRLKEIYLRENGAKKSIQNLDYNYKR
jgi:hypothetical protein